MSFQGFKNDILTLPYRYWDFFWLITHSKRNVIIETIQHSLLNIMNTNVSDFNVEWMTQFKETMHIPTEQQD